MEFLLQVSARRLTRVRPKTVERQPARAAKKRWRMSFPGKWVAAVASRLAEAMRPEPDVLAARWVWLTSRSAC